MPSPKADPVNVAIVQHPPVYHDRNGCLARANALVAQAATIGPGGELIGVHRKLMPTHAERMVWGMGDGSHLVVHDTPVGRLGGLICWEHWMPLSRHVLHSQGEQIHVALWPEAPDMHQVASRHYAFEGRCFVVCAATFMTIDDVPLSFELRDTLLQGAPADMSGADGVLLPGGSGLIDPDGQWISGPVSMKADIIYGTIDLNRITEEQFAMDAAGHYSRPDVFDLQVRSQPLSPFRRE